MIKYVIYAFPLFCLLCASCSTLPEDLPSEDREALCRKSGQEVTSAVISGDYQKYLDGSGEKGNAEDEKNFAESRKNLFRQFGTPKRAAFLTGLKAPLVINHLWIFDFEQKNRTGKIIPHQQIMQIVWGERDGKNVLLGMRFL